MKKLATYLLLFTISVSALAQDAVPSKRFERTQFEAGVTLSAASGIFTASPSAIQYWSLGKNKNNFKIGLGARLSSSFGSSDLEYITADAKLTSGKTGPGVFFADQIPENIDTLSISNTQSNALNLYLALRYDFHPKFGAEFNIDLAGASFGPRQDAVLSYNNKIQNTNAYPTAGNVLLVSDNDIGTLNSEFMVYYKYKNRLRFKVGAVFLFNEYTISSPVSYVNVVGKTIETDRYRNKSFQIGVGVNYALKYFRAQ